MRPSQYFVGLHAQPAWNATCHSNGHSSRVHATDVHLDGQRAVRKMIRKLNALKAMLTIGCVLMATATYALTTDAALRTATTNDLANIPEAAILAAGGVAMLLVAHIARRRVQAQRRPIG